MRRHRRDPRDRPGPGDGGAGQLAVPLPKVLIDDKQGEIVGFWKQVATDADGAESEIYGIGGSWFRLTEKTGGRSSSGSATSSTSVMSRSSTWI